MVNRPIRTRIATRAMPAPSHTTDAAPFTASTPSTPPASPRQAYTIAQFCQQFGISRASFYREVEAGRIPTRKVGRRTLVRACDAQAWLDALPMGSAA